MTRARLGDLTLYRRLLSQARPYWPHLIGVFLIRLLSPPLALLSPLPLKLVVDSVIGTHPLPGFLELLLPPTVATSGTTLLLLAVGLLVGIAVVQHFQSIIMSVLDTYTGEKLILSFRAQLFGHLQRLSLSYHDTQGTADSVYRIQYDAPAIQQVAIYGLIPVVTQSMTFAGMVYVTARLDAELALVAVVVSPVLYILAHTYRGWLRRGWSDVKDLQSSAMSVVHEALAAMRVVKAFGQEDRELERFVRSSGRVLRRQIQVSCINQGFALLVGVTLTAGTAVVLFIGVLHVQSGILTLGELIMVMTYLTQLYWPLETMSTRITDLQASLASAERAFALLDQVPDVKERANARPLSRAAGHLVFRNVSFGYGEASPVLRDISLEIPPATRVGISGATGAGKTTLANLLTRFYDPTEGQILMDGVDLRDYRVADLRNQFGIVLQEPVLFSTSVAENIAYGRPGASEEQIVRAAKAANIHGFVVNLRDGYDTQVGERGMLLSGGERQRIALARAFLKDAPILILDEPTSAVDLKTEAEIMETMDRLMKGRTTFLIAHRESTLRGCDLLLVLQDRRLWAVNPALAPAVGPAPILRQRNLGAREGGLGS